VWGTPEETRELAAWFANQFCAPATAQLVTSQGWVAQGGLDAMVPEILAWGDRPDAYFAVMGVAAIGWKGS
jgi:hypothetical protein